MLHINHISKTFNKGTINEKQALRDLQLHLEPGDFVTVIGGNGAVKSTMLNAVAGVWPVDEGRILLDGKVVGGAAEHVYLMLNKPRGYLTSVSDPDGRRCVTDLLDGVNTRVYPVGRLDKCSEGILILTDDGALANRLMHPKHNIGKYYRVKVGGRVTPEQYSALTSPMEIDGYTIRPVQVTITSEDDEGTVLKMTLFEGRNRQIRKMCEQVGLTVKRLSRVAIGKIKLNGLPVGQYRHLTEEEVAYLYQNTKQ